MVTINQTWLQQNINEKAHYSYWEHFKEYLGKSVGVFRALQGTQKSMNVGSLMVEGVGYAAPSAVKSLGRNLGTGVAALGLPKIPSATSDAIKALSDLTKVDDVSFVRKAVKAVRETADMIATVGFASIFVTGSPALATVAQVTDFTSDVADLTLSVSDYQKASALELGATGDAKVAVSHTRKYNFLRVVKATASVAAAIFGSVLLILGMPILALAVIGLTATFFAIARDIYKESGRFRVINLDRPVMLASI
ncbi:MAG TPA: hypothetical protein VLF94_05360 [Chlamydiales bacterium]|nr:hypothetical protein [Chlamydiales bacterium]